MINEFVHEWLNALKSGKYDQTTEVLKDDTGYCCLGVACDIHPDVKFEKCDIADNYYTVVNTNNTSELPHKVMNSMNLKKDSDPHLSFTPHERAFDWINEKFMVSINTTIPLSIDHYSWDLATFNDQLEFTFDQIAEFIETFPELFFEEIPIHSTKDD